MMKKKYSFLPIFFLLLAGIFFSGDLTAKHIVGGDVTYTCKGINGGFVTFEITFTMYRDSRGGGADFDRNAIFGIFRGNGNDWEFVDFKEESPMNIVSDLHQYLSQNGQTQVKNWHRSLLVENCQM